MDEMDSRRRRRHCPHCGKEIPRLPVKPRDLGLLLNVLLYRVPVEKEISEEWIEVARQHCRMKPERLAEVRAGLHARHWPRMIERRAARLSHVSRRRRRTHRNGWSRRRFVGRRRGIEIQVARSDLGRKRLGDADLFER
jgi:hypothetical protein